MKVLIIVVLYFSLCSALFSQEKLQVSDTVELRPITASIYRHISYKFMEPWGNVPANGLVVVHGGEAILIDTPWTNKQTESLVNFLNDSLAVQVKGVVATHWHEDCMGGLEYLHKIDVKSYSTKLTQKFAGDAQLFVPQTGFDDSMVIQINDKKLVCKYFGGGHTVDNSVVWIPDEKVLFSGCMVKSLRSTNLGYTKEADMEQWPTTLEKVLNAFPDAEFVIPGHGSPGNLDLIHHTLQLLKTTEHGGRRGREMKLIFSR